MSSLLISVIIILFHAVKIPAVVHFKAIHVGGSVQIIVVAPTLVVISVEALMCHGHPKCSQVMAIYPILCAQLYKQASMNASKLSEKKLICFVSIPHRAWCFTKLVASR